MNKRKLHWTLWSALVLLSLLLSTMGHSTAAPLSPAETSYRTQNYGAIPLHFVENRGQLDEQVAYYLMESEKDICFTSMSTENNTQIGELNANLLINSNFDELPFYWEPPNDWVAGSWERWWLQGTVKPEFNYNPRTNTREIIAYDPSVSRNPIGTLGTIPLEQPTSTPSPTATPLLVSNAQVRIRFSGRTTTNPDSSGHNVLVRVIIRESMSGQNLYEGIDLLPVSGTTSETDYGTITLSALADKDIYVGRQYELLITGKMHLTRRWLVTFSAEQSMLDLSGENEHLWAGDLNDDNRIDEDDYDIFIDGYLRNARGETLPPELFYKLDLNGDGKISISDHDVFVHSYNNGPGIGAEGDAYEPDDTCAQAKAIPTDGTVQHRTFHKQSDEDWAVFQATAGVTYRVEGQVPVGSPADVNLEIYAQCADDPLDEQHNSFAPGVRLEFTAPADGPLYLRWLNHDPAVYGDDVAYHISVQALAAEVTPGAVIIVAGRDKHHDTLQTNIHYAAGQFYQMFQNNGYPANRIYYLSTDLTQPGANALATAGNLEGALTTWTLDKVADDRPLTLYLIDHGMPNRLYLDKPAGEWVTPTQLDTWLAQVEAAHPGLKVNVFVEACYAGSFIGLPQSLSRAGRVVATSTGAMNLAYASAKGAVFSDYFSAALNQGMSVYSAFESARGATRAAYPYQTPWLDVNGNGIPNEPEDAQIAAARGFAYAGTLSSDQWPPYIAQVAPVTVSNGQGDLRVEARDDGEVRYVWAVIYPPSYTPPATQEELVQETLPTVMLLRQSAGWYSAQYTGFAELGEYRVVFYAEDDLGLAAQPVAVTVRTGWGVYLPLVVRQ